MMTDLHGHRRSLATGNRPFVIVAATSDSNASPTSSGSQERPPDYAVADEPPTALATAIAAAAARAAAAAAAAAEAKKRLQQERAAGGGGEGSGISSTLGGMLLANADGIDEDSEPWNAEKKGNSVEVNTFFLREQDDQVRSVVELSLPRPVLKGRLFDMLRDHYDGRMTVTSQGPQQLSDDVDMHHHITRLVCVIDVSQSMGDSYGSEDVSKLDRVKAFVHLLMTSLNDDDSLGIVSFGTKAEVTSRLRKMTPDAKEEALIAVEKLMAGGVTNLADGISTALNLFRSGFLKGRFFDDNILIFTDGMSNEGVRDTASIISEMRRAIAAIRLDCHFEEDYTVRVSAVGTGGFFPETICEIAQTFSSDPFFLLLNKAYLELSLMKPVVQRQQGKLFNVFVELTPLNGVLVQQVAHPLSFPDPVRAGPVNVSPAAGAGDLPAWTSTLQVFIHDMRQSNNRHVTCRLKLPKKHRKVLQGKDVLQVTVRYRDIDSILQTMTSTVTYDSLPRKEKYNEQTSAVAVFEQDIRLATARAFGDAASRMQRLDRRGASTALQTAADGSRTSLGSFATKWKLTEEAQAELSQTVELYARNLEGWSRRLADMALSWDDVWGALKCLELATARESATLPELYAAPGAELYVTAEARQQELRLCDVLRRVYVRRHMNTKPLDIHEFALQARDEEQGSEEGRAGSEHSTEHL